MDCILKLIHFEEIQKITDLNIEKTKKLQIISYISRLNTLTSIKKAGSGHIGSSFSAMDIVTYLYHCEMNINKNNLNNPNRNIYFSSKGHDVPGLYSVLYSIGIISKDQLLKLRCLGGLDGHPDLSIQGIEANSGSLGMGISKAKGISIAKKIQNLKGHIFVLLGDGELQEGQIFESLQTVVHQKVKNLTVIVDHNKVQSDKEVSGIINLGNLEKKFNSFGWNVIRIDGHNYSEIEKAINEAKNNDSNPNIIIADTIKGKGVSFMEHPLNLSKNNGIYTWHSGSPDNYSYNKAINELIEKINTLSKEIGIENINVEEIEIIPEIKKNLKDVVANAYGRKLLELGEKRKNIVVLDADLADDCKIRDFESKFPDRFIENGICEQDMVSTAGGLARIGLLPIVNSFSSFLSSRANEQIYNNATELTKIIYVCHFSGLLPAGPGKSHQSVRDISLFGALPNCTIIQPCNEYETELVVEYCVEKSDENCMIRLIIGPSPEKIELPENYKFEFGKGNKLTQGKDSIIFAYGPVMLNEALKAHKLLLETNYEISVVNLPWLNRINTEWLKNTVKDYKNIFVIEDHSSIGGLGDFLLNKLSENNLLNNRNFVKFGVNDYPACGKSDEVLDFHGLSSNKIKESILKHI